MEKPVARWMVFTAWVVLVMLRREAVANTDTWLMFKASKVFRKDIRPNTARAMPSRLSAPSST